MFLPHTNLDYFPSVKKKILSRKKYLESRELYAQL